MRPSASASSDLAVRDLLTLVLILSVHALFNALFSPLGMSSSEYPEYLGYAAFGVITVQPMLLGAWAAIGATSLVSRIPCSAVACLCLAAAAVVTRSRVFGDPGPFAADDFLGMTLLMLGLFLGSASMLLIVRRVTGYRIEVPCAGAAWGSEACGPRGDVQFGIRYLLVWTAVSAIVLALGRLLASEGNWIWIDSSIGELAVRVAAVTGALLLMLIPPLAVCWLALSDVRVSWRAAIAGLLVWVLSTCAAAYVLYAAAHAMEPLWELLWSVVLVQLGATAVAWLTALPLRLRGFRFRSR